MAGFDSTTDVRSMAAQFVAVDRAGADSVLARQKSYYQNRLNAYDAIAAKIQAFQTILADLKTAGKFNNYTATTSVEGYARVTASADAAAGVYSIHVSRLASAHQLALDFSSEDWLAPATGNLELSLGADSFSVDFSSLPAGSTLATVRDAINGAGDNPGVRASLVRTGGAVKLLLTSEETGAANVIGLSTTATDPDLQSAVAGMQTLSLAQDAEIQLGSSSPITITAASNRLENVIDGITIDLARAHTDPTERLDISVARDMEASREQLHGFVDSYNGLVEVLKKYTASTDGSKPILAGDSTGRLLVQQLRSQFNNLPGGATMGMLGLDTDRYGKLSLDGDQLDSYLTENPAGLEAVFGGTDGLMSKLDALAKPYVTGNDSVLKSRSMSMQTGLDRVADRQEVLDNRMTQVYNRYLAQFTNMQNLVMQMQQTFNMFV